MPGTSKYSLGKRGGGSKPVEIQLPSYVMDEHGQPTGEHNVALVRVPDPMALIGMGILDSVDSLTRLVGLKIDEIEASGKPSSQAATIKKLSESKDDLMAGVDLIDKVVEWMVVEPKCIRPVVRDEAGQPVKVDGKEVRLADEARDPDQLYTDEVDLEDRMFILNYAVGGSRDLDSFREGTQAVMDAVAASEALPLPTL